MAAIFARAAVTTATTSLSLVPRLGFIGLGNMGLQMAQNLFLKSAAASAVSSPLSSSPPDGMSKSPIARREFVVCDPNPDNVLLLVNFVSKNIDGAEVIVVDTPFE
jgi:hypothetical protein